MDLLKLPDDVIKYVELYVDNRPPFADELLNYDFKKYEYKCFYKDYADELHKFDINWEMYEYKNHYISDGYVCYLITNNIQVCELSYGFIYGVEYAYIGVEVENKILSTIGYLMQNGQPRLRIDCGTQRKNKKITKKKKKKRKNK